ncbi:hydroxylase [Alsobacter soli]|uniref:Hydroxylase n=1 Tax=Alsobacter soli TaxID=2109933 RepID=A0A2T1HZC6_9HYPH|nr:metal-sulfur cluster assembly factor [Alsobacter soli]PSC07053.1 hydroxylase [Alsobacter soli]
MHASTHTLDPAILQAIADVRDPELGVGIVDLGLVYRARRAPGRVDVAITLTSRGCPLAGLILEETKVCLEDRFGAATAVGVELVWEPRWTPDRMSGAARALLSR